MGNKKTVYVAGYYGFGNTGDEAILAAIVAQFRSRDPQLRVLVASGNPEKTAAVHAVEALPWNDIAAIHRAQQSADLVVVGGGGLFHDYWGVDPDTFLTDRHWGASYYAGSALLANLYRKPVMLYAVGVGPLFSEHGRRLTRLAAEAAQAITVRDEGSKALLEEMGIATGKIRVTADPAFTFQPSPDFKLQDALPEDFALRGPVLGVAVRDWNIGVHSLFLQRELAAALDLFLETTDGSVVLIPFQDLEEEGTNDRAIAQLIVKQMRLSHRAAVTSGPTTPDQAYCFVRDCDLILGMRMHSLVFAAMADRPAVALCYDPKVKELVARLGFEDLSIDVQDISAARLASKLTQAASGGERSEAITQAVAELKRAETENASIAFELLNGPASEASLGEEALELLARSLYRGAVDARQSGMAAGNPLRQLAKDYQTVKEENLILHQRVAELKESASKEFAHLTESWRALEHANQFLHQRITEIAASATQQLGQVTEHCRAVEQENRILHRSSADITAQHLEISQRYAREKIRFTEDRDWLLNQKVELEQRLAAINEQGGGIERYRGRLESDLAVYRSQRAWKAMLVCRKAYTLLRRSKIKFLAWALGLPFGRVGDLSEYELRFPEINGFMPDSLSPADSNLSDSVPRKASAAATAISAESVPALQSSNGAHAPSGPRTPRNQYDVIVLAIIDFDFRFQRPQQLAAEFARRGHRVFWVSPTRFLDPGSPAAHEVNQLRENLWEVHLRSRQPDIYMGELSAEHVAAMTDSLDHFCREWGIAGHTILVQLPFWRKLALKLRAMLCSIILYDCMDDWDTFENLGAFNLSEEKYLASECDVLVVTGSELVRKFSERGLRPVLARNGADFRFFSQAQPNDLLAGVPRPIIGYFGAIADWIDLDLVYEVARNRSQYSFVLIGQVFGRDVSRLQALPNVRLLGNKPYSEIPSYLYNFDACMIPFLINQVTKATDPVKLYEYFSLGKPVVATEMAELKQCGELVYLARDAGEFANKLDLAISEDGETVAAQRIEFAKANTWSSRVADIDRAIREGFPLVSILIVTHNSAEFLRPCLESIFRNTAYPSFEVVLVDNASTDDTAKLAEEYASRDGRLRATILPKNLGFAGGNNRAAGEAQGEYLLFLNIDTMVTPGWIERLLRHVRRDPSIGLLCPVTNFAGNEIKINFNYRNWRDMERFADAVANEKSGEKMEVEVAPLYCALMPRAVWEQIGEMDTRYEIGMFEDDDLSVRVRQAGYRVFAAEDCFVHHFGQGSFSKLSPETYNRIFETNRKRFEQKWTRTWVAHRTRPGVRPAIEEERFDPVQFTH